MKRIPLLCCLFIWHAALSQPQVENDSTQKAQPDSIVFIHPINDIGAVEPFTNSFTVITANDIPHREYRSLYDLLSTLPGVFIRDLASPGHQNQIIVNGFDENSIGIMIDGIPYNNYYTGSLNLWNIPVENIDRVEFISGPEALFYNGVSSGAVINIITKNYNNNTAYTKLRYSQGVDGYVQTDATFAQNIAKDLNLSIGLTHYSFGSNKDAKGFIGRFYNSNDDAWNFRMRMRYNISDDMDVLYTYHYTKTWTGLNGGINYYNTASFFDPLNATINNSDAYEKLDNGYSNITFAYKPSSDSSKLITLTGYYFDRLREYRDDENRQYSNGIQQDVNFPSIEKGVKGQFLFSGSTNRLILYGIVNQPLVGHTWITIMGVKDDIRIFDAFALTGFAVMANNGTSIGGRGTLRIDNSFSFYGSVSRLNATESSNHYIDQFEGGVNVTVGDMVNGKIYFQNSSLHHSWNVQTGYDSSGLTYTQFIPNGKNSYTTISTYLHVHWNDIHLEGTVNYFKQPDIVVNTSHLKLFPDITANGSLYYKGLLANGHFDVKIGFRGRYFSEQTGMSPYDLTGEWSASSMVEYGRTGTFDFFMTGKIGDAYLHFIWENLAGNNYLLAPIYPMYGRNIRFGVTWEFLN